MSDAPAEFPPRFLRTPEAARLLGLSGRTLEKHRTYGTGPKYRKIGGRVVYALDDLKAWADRGARTSTSDPGTGTVFPAKRRLAAGMKAPRSVAVDHPRGNAMRKIAALVAHIHNRLSVGEQPRPYTRSRHQAWLHRRKVSP